MENTESQKTAIRQMVAAAKGPYSDAALMEAGPARRAKYKLTGDADSMLPARVLGVLTVRGELPLQMNFVRNESDESIEMWFEVVTTDAMPPQLLLSRLLNLPTVREASLLP